MHTVREAFTSQSIKICVFIGGRPQEVPELAALPGQTEKQWGKKIYWHKKSINLFINFSSVLGPEATEKKTQPNSAETSV